MSPLNWPMFLVALCSAATTLAGGALALRLQPFLRLLLGLSAGTILGVALFDLLPEALRLGPARDSLAITSAVAAGFLVYVLLDLVLSRLASRPGRRSLGPASLVFHSFIDGLAVGVAFDASLAVGLMVALAVLSHDIVDGANTVTLSLAGGGSRQAARRWLMADAVAPVVGIGGAQFITLPPGALVTLLAATAGCLLYISASELLPSTADTGKRLSTFCALGLGLGIVRGIVQLAG